MLETYINDSYGGILNRWMKCNIVDIFKIDREGEAESIE